jgi:hypothetical protein
MGELMLVFLAMETYRLVLYHDGEHKIWKMKVVQICSFENGIGVNIVKELQWLTQNLGILPVAEVMEGNSKTRTKTK